MPKPLFELEQVSLTRAGAVVLRELTAETPVGASCIAGPSGSGKSTLLRLLDRLVDPDTGVVRYRGRDVCEYDPLALRREVCLVPQLPAPLEGTVEDNVLYGVRLLGRDADVPRLLELCGLDPGFAARDASQLSVGEQQRVMLARALALQPAVLLLDEPTSALDESARDAVERALVHLREELELSYVLVTHDLGQAARMADWVLQLDLGGRVVGQGAAAELLGVPT
jgi:ABC-type cobalamin/Fe3+-siderophores transport system ATPase subunit